MNASSEDSSDYYAILGLSPNASTRDIQQAYRRASLIFHPDKQNDEEVRLSAQLTFQQIHEAYNEKVLMDPDLRAVYDTVGIKGLAFKELQAAITCGVDLSGLTDSQVDNKIALSEISIITSSEIQINENIGVSLSANVINDEAGRGLWTLTKSINVNFPDQNLILMLHADFNARMGFQFGCSVLGMTMKTSTSYHTNNGPSLKVNLEQSIDQNTSFSTNMRLSFYQILLILRLTKGHVTYVVPISSTNDQQSLTTILCGVLTNCIVQWSIKLVSRKFAELPDEEKKQGSTYLGLLEKRKLALDQQNLLSSTASRISGLEGSNGLIIIEAIYGDVESNNNRNRLNVTIPLQAMVSNHKLILHGGSKDQYHGFYNPNMHTIPRLFIKYSFEGQIIEKHFNDNDAVILP